ncbi:MAG: ABC transporter ATP-binding protein [Gammaproteobacteria bacterium]|nr:ABC transporter ATP-binding protein [Gammaproteobacteria bacterium]
MTALLDVRGLDVAIAGRTICAGLDLSIHAGQSWVLLGRNGAGKTTLLHSLAGLRPAHGSIRLQGSALAGLSARERARRVAVLLQHSDRGFGTSALESVLTGRHPHLGRLAWEGPEDLAIAERCLAATDSQALAERPLDTLSGGELRRVEIARLLAQQAPLMLLDEPFNHLDLGHQASVLRVLKSQVAGQVGAFLMSIHDLNLAWQAGSHWLLLDGDGGWHAGPREEIATATLLSDAFDHPVLRLETDAGVLFRAQL